MFAFSSTDAKESTRRLPYDDAETSSKFMSAQDRPSRLHSREEAVDFVHPLYEGFGGKGHKAVRIIPSHGIGRLHRSSSCGARHVTRNNVHIFCGPFPKYISQSKRVVGLSITTLFEYFFDFVLMYFSCEYCVFAAKVLLLSTTLVRIVAPDSPFFFSASISS